MAIPQQRLVTAASCGGVDPASTHHPRRRVVARPIAGSDRERGHYNGFVVEIMDDGRCRVFTLVVEPPIAG